MRDLNRYDHDRLEAALRGLQSASGLLGNLLRNRRLAQLSPSLQVPCFGNAAMVTVWFWDPLTGEAQRPNADDIATLRRYIAIWEGDATPEPPKKEGD